MRTHTHLQLGERAVLVEHGVSLLEGLALLGRRRQHHALVRPVDLEEDRALAVDGHVASFVKVLNFGTQQCTAFGIHELNQM